MKKISGVWGVLLLAAQLSAQSNAPVRLALIAETGEAASASDVLTAQLSGNPKIQLLERNEIGKVYREQGLSAANRDDLKLGRILGADGLMLFDIVRTPQATNLTTRLIAIKPGVVLTDGSFPWPLKDTGQWSESVATYLNSFLPKLALLARDAIPLSVVNLRSAVPSSEAQETERQLKLLTIQRLSQERPFFVLERQRMQLLSEEKELKSDNSAFWDGSYLLEGVVDQNGYSRETITIDVRLTPPKGGAPLQFEVSGSRTNYAEVINRLAAKVTELLKVNSPVKEWNAADEAEQYFDEAKWALKWGVFSEAQAAADSAWALGKHDMDCAMVEVQAYEVPPNTGGYQEGEFTNPRSTNEVIQVAIEHAAPNRLWGLTWNEQNHNGIKVVQYVSVGRFPDPKSIDLAIHALQLYYDFSRTLPPSEPKADTAWYRLGIEALVTASQVLQHFNFVPESQKSATDKLADLRSMARSVAEWISQSPSAHDSYFVGDRLVTHDELANSIEENPNIFRCKVKWGCFWQERPEDGVALYRELLSSPVFCYIHQDFWLRNLQTPRLAAWNEDDRKRVPVVWKNFVRELDDSTNVLWELEGKALLLADADNEKKMAVAFTNFFNVIFENRDALVANKVDVLYLNWGADALVEAKTSGGIVTDIKDSLRHIFDSEYRPKLEAMDQEYWNKTAPAGQFLSVFEKQKQYLKENKPYDFIEFAHTFLTGGSDYSRTQALEIQPLLATYKSNLVVQSRKASGIQKAQLLGAIAQVGFMEDDTNRILNPPTPPLRPRPAIIQRSNTFPIAKGHVANPIFTNAPEVVTNVIVVNKFFAMPVEKLIILDSNERIENSQVTITAHHWFEGRLVLDCGYNVGTQQSDTKGNVLGGRNAGGLAIAIFDPTTEHWDIVGCPKTDILTQNNFYHRTVVVHGDLFNCDDKQIRKYDRQNQQWQVLGISDGNNYELFAVNGHFYAANRNLIFEITDGGKSMHILASNRRQPPVSALDREDLGLPTLFTGPAQSLRVSTQNKIFTWTGNDWREDCATPFASSQPEIFEDGVLFRKAGFMSAGYQNDIIVRRENGTYGTLDSQDEIYCVANETNVARLCLSSRSQTIRGGFSKPGTKTVQFPRPIWKMPANMLPNLPAALRQSNLYFLVDAFAANVIVNDQHEILQGNLSPKDGYNAALLCFSDGFPFPQKILLKFDAPDARTPDWIYSTPNFLLIGSESALNSIGPVRGGNSGRSGIWIMPISEIESRVATQQQMQLSQKEQDVAALKQGQENSLAKGVPARMQNSQAQ